MPRYLIRKLTLLLLCFSGKSLAQSAKEAEALLYAGDVDSALGAARASIKANPSDTESHLLLIDILMSQGLGATAQAVYKDFAKANPKSDRAWILLGRAATSSATATEAYQQALELNPHNARAWCGMGDIYRAAGPGGVDNAIVAYEKAIELDAQLAEAYTGLGSLYLKADRAQDAARVVQQATLQVPEDSEAFLAAAALMPNQALTFLEKGSKSASKDPRLHAALGHARLKRGEIHKAKKALAKALKIHAHHPQAAFDMEIISEIEQGVLDLKAWDKLLKAKASLSKSPKAAVELHQSIHKKHPKSALALLTLGHALVSENRLGEAQAALEKGLAIRPENSDLNATLGLLFQAQQKHVEALPLIELAALARPLDPSLQVAYGISAANVRGPRMGAQILATAAERFPSDPRPAMALATLLTKNGDAPSAYTVLNRAVAQYPAPDLLLALAGAAKEIGKTKEAIDALERLSELTGDPSWQRAAQSLKEGLK